MLSAKGGMMTRFIVNIAGIIESNQTDAKTLYEQLRQKVEVLELTELTEVKVEDTDKQVIVGFRVLRVH